MNIMFIVPKISGGGAEKVIARLASETAEKHRVYLVTTMRGNTAEEYPLSAKVTRYNLYDWAEANRPFERTASFTAVLPERMKRILKRIIPAKRQTRITMDQRAFRISVLKRMKQELETDCAVSFLNSANYLNAMSKRGELNIVSVRSCLSGKYAPAEIRTEEGHRMVEETCAAADLIVCVSKETADVMHDEYGAPEEKLRVIYNMCDAEQIRQMSMEENIPLNAEDNTFRIFMMGRMTEKKGQWHFLRAFREIHRRRPETRLYILGSEGKGNEDVSGMMKDYVQKKGMEDCVRFLGFHLNPYPYLAQADLFVLPSFNEGFPNSLTEAMALGIPVISADCSSGPREILAPDTDARIKTETIEYARYGVLVPQCSGNRDMEAPAESAEEMMIEAVIRMIDDPAVRRHYSETGRTRTEDYSREKTIKAWEHLMESRL